MQGSLDGAKSLIGGIVALMTQEEDALDPKCAVVVCPPFVHMASVRHALHGYPKIVLGAQDCSAHDNGAYTGDVSAEMLKDLGCSYVIVGHSERRQYHGESDALIAQKIRRIWACDMTPILCVGETEAEREAGQAESVVARQLEHALPPSGPFDALVIAYEPVWAIGTGKTATPADAGAMHAFIRQRLSRHVPAPEKVPILYGGSMKPENAGALLATPEINGGLIGGASLQPDQFLALARAV